MSGSGRRWRSRWARGVLLVLLALTVHASAQSPPVVPYPRDYKTALVKYGVVDRPEGMSRDLYVSRDALDALKQNPRLQELPVGALFALDVYSARSRGKDGKTQAARFETTAQGHLVRAKDERTLHLMQKIQSGASRQSWAFGGYDTLTGVPLKLQLPGDCVLCHEAALVSDMSFSMKLLKRFAASGAVQYSFCPQPGRQSCPF
jgi:hypothetical protein